MDNEQLARFWDWVQENINDQQEQHKDYMCPDLDLKTCDNAEEHKFLFSEAGTTMDWIIKTTGTERK